MRQWYQVFVVSRHMAIHELTGCSSTCLDLSLCTLSDSCVCMLTFVGE